MSDEQTHVHRIKFTPNKVLSKELEITRTANIKGLTLYQMIISHGTPSDPSSTAVTTCPGKLDWVVKNSMDINGPLIIQYQSLNGINNLPVTAGQHTMDIGAGSDHLVSQS